MNPKENEREQDNPFMTGFVYYDFSARRTRSVSPRPTGAYYDLSSVIDFDDDKTERFYTFAKPGKITRLKWKFSGGEFEYVPQSHHFNASILLDSFKIETKVVLESLDLRPVISDVSSVRVTLRTANGHRILLGSTDGNAFISLESLPSAPEPTQL